MAATAREEGKPAGSLPVSRRTLLKASGASLGVAVFGWGALSPSLSASAAGTYLRPCGDVRISDSWQGHRNRNPPSGEPGTDYAVPQRTPVVAATDGVIVDRKDSTSTATGRYLALRADDGNYIRYLHLRSSAVPVGTRVARGRVIAASGGSGFGSENGYGAHVHVSMWFRGTPAQQGFRNTVDFERYVEKKPTQPDTEDSVPLHHSTTYAWNGSLPAGSWTPMQIGAGRVYLARSGNGIEETGEVVINLRASGVTSGLQVRLMAEFLSSSGSVVRRDAQPVVEIPRTADSGGPTYGQYVMPYFLSGSIRMLAQVRALNPGVVVEEVVFKKNYWVAS